MVATVAARRRRPARSERMEARMPFPRRRVIGRVSSNPSPAPAIQSVTLSRAPAVLRSLRGLRSSRGGGLVGTPVAARSMTTSMRGASAGPLRTAGAAWTRRPSAAVRRALGTASGPSSAVVPARARLAGAMVRGASLVVEVGEHDPWHGAAKKALDRGQLLQLLGGDQGEGVAYLIHPPGPSDAVHVVLGGVRHVVVDDVGDSLDVDPARGDVGRDQDLDPSPAQIQQRALALALAPIPVKGGDRVAAPLEIPRQLLRAVLRPREHDHAAHFGPGEHGT